MDLPIIIYLIIISALALYFTVRDKNAARKHGRRVRERTLFLLAILGGSAVMYAAMLSIRHKTKHRRFTVGIPIIIVVQVLMGIGFYRGLAVRTYTIQSDLITDGITVVYISDLHNTLYGENQKVLVDKIAEHSPDLILLGGDLYEHYSYNSHGDIFEQSDAMYSLLNQILPLAPIYSVMGNHEKWSGQLNEARLDQLAMGITVLNDQYREIEVNGNKVVIAGTESRGDFEDTKTVLAEASAKDGYKILLSHYPENIESYLPYNFDLILNGHAHGGQARIPFILNGVYSPSEGLFPKYAGGRYNHGETVQIVSRGLSKKPWILPRFYNRPELVVVKLT